MVVAGFSEERRDHLAHLEQEHFWFEARYALLGKVLDRMFPGRSHRAIELGCGTGMFLPTLACKFETVVGIDAYAESLSRARERCPTARLIRADVREVPLEGGAFDAAIAFDVLEHVEPLPFLREMRRLVRPGGQLLISVPSNRWLWSFADERAGHRCRYGRRQLAGELASSGWHLNGQTHYQCLLAPLMFMSRRLVPSRLRDLDRRPPWWVGRALGAINALEVSLLSDVSLPTGSSLIAWARTAE